ncbi:MAG: class I SAM-dependent methyltransferase [Candidatus Omnitrophica bacterium]|nr:class I SAM-dependent methyltransferase [Candidatus Omnitrophota bacterium]
MEKIVLENHERYRDRIKLFKSFGYDIDKERDFIIENAQPIEGKILELGTGKGHFAVALAQKGYQFTTVDISEEEQKFAKMNIQYLGLQDQVNFVIADAQHLHFPDASYDISFGINLIHHLSQPLKVVDEFLRVTAPKGKIVISDFSKEGFTIIKELHKSEGNHHDSGHCTLNEIAEYVLSKGFQIDKFNSKCQELIIIRKRGN